MFVSIGFPTLAAARRIRSTRADSRAARLKHIKCAYYRMVEDRPVAWVSRRFRISARTVSLWAKAALGYHDPEASALRDLIERPRSAA